MAQNNSSFLFVGVTTHQSAVNNIFQAWCNILGVNDCKLIGVDKPIDSDISALEDVFLNFRSERCSGGLITSHKTRMYDYLSDNKEVFLNSSAKILREISVIYKENGEIKANALDSIASGNILNELFDTNTWKNGEHEVIIAGGGGAAVALLCALQGYNNQLKKVQLFENNAARVDFLRENILVDNENFIQATLELAEELETKIAKAPPGTLIVNATGVGKDRAGKIISDKNMFPFGAIIWEFNYRGQLDFLHDARNVASEKGLIVECGWRYFIHGWMQHMCTVFNIVPTEKILIEFMRVANPYAPPWISNQE